MNKYAFWGIASALALSVLYGEVSKAQELTIDSSKEGTWSVFFNTFHTNEDGSHQAMFRYNDNVQVDHKFFLKVHDNVCKTGLGVLQYSELNEDVWKVISNVSLFTKNPSISDINAAILCKISDELSKQNGTSKNIGLM